MSYLELNVDPRAPAPLYRQIVDQVRRLIALGALAPGDRFPTVRELAAKVGVNRNTAARAVADLERAGLVRTRVGQGTYVTENVPGAIGKNRESDLDAAIEALLVAAHTSGVPLEELGWRMQRKIEEFARVRRERERSW